MIRRPSLQLWFPKYMVLILRTVSYAKIPGKRVKKEGLNRHQLFEDEQYIKTYIESLRLDNLNSL